MGIVFGWHGSGNLQVMKRNKGNYNAELENEYRSTGVHRRALSERVC